MKFKPNEVTILSTENKQLPFPNAKLFNYVDINDYEDFRDKLPETLNDDKTKVIVIDSLTRILSMVKYYLEAKKVSGYKFWKKYGDIIEKILMFSVKTKKWLIYTSLSDISYNADGDEIRQVKIQGNQLNGLIESFFTIVLFTDINNKVDNIKDKYRFCTNTDGINTAKTPMGLINKQYIPNDLSIVLEKVAKYYDIELDNFDIKRPSILIVGRSGSGKSTSLHNLIKKPKKKKSK